MRIAKLVGIEPQTNDSVFNMASEEPRTGGNSGKPRPASVKTTPEESRVGYPELESAYINRPNIFNGINKIVQTVMSAECNLEGTNEEYKDYVAYVLEHIGSKGGQLTWKELKDKIIRYNCIYGNVWVELIRNVGDTEIVDLDFIDPKKMDYAKDSNQNISLDQYGNPIGYVETLPMGVNTEGINKIKPPESVTLSQNQLFLPADRVAHFKFYTVGDGFYGIGLVEPSYKAIVRGMNMEQALANWTYNSGFPPRVVYVGDERNPPNIQKIDSALKAVKELNYKQNLSIPYYMKVELLEAKSAGKIRDNLEYFKEAEVTSLGIPKPFVTGGGEETNRATLVNQDSMFRLTLRDVMQQFGASLRKLVFRPIIKMKYPDADESEIPYLEWGEIGSLYKEEDGAVKEDEKK
jgi:hypothetical protein